MPKLANAVVRMLGETSKPLSVSRAKALSRFWAHWSATTTSPMSRPSSTPPAMPEKTMRVMLKRSRAIWVVMAALTIDTPLRNTTTGLPSS